MTNQSIKHTRKTGLPSHGGDVYSEGILKGKNLIDFSSNINPLGVPLVFSHHIEEGIKACTRYPDIQYRQLKENLCTYLDDGFTEANILLGNGAAEVIDLVISCFAKILIIAPSFSEYVFSAEKWKCQIEYSCLDQDMEMDFTDIASKLAACDAVIIGNPNNPNGALADKIKWKEILDFAEIHHKTVILDEAFIEFTGNMENSFEDKIKAYDCIFIIRALTKFYGLPGIRFGYGISRDIDLLSKCKEKQNPWNINCFAELAVKYVLQDTEYIKESLAWMQEEGNYLPKALEKICFIEKIFPSRANFILCKLKGITSRELCDFCLVRGIIIRDASNFIGLDDRYVRFAIKSRADNDCLLALLHRQEEML